MTCQHTNPVGYLFCSTCGQSLKYQRCWCGFVCAEEALYCGRCGHSFVLQNVDEDLTIENALERRYDLDLLVKLAGVAHKDKTTNIVDESNIKKGNK